MRVGASGHQGLDARTVALVRQRLAIILPDYAPMVGVTMLGPGADQVFASEVLGQGGDLHVIVPATKYRDGFEDQDAQQGYDKLIAHAKHIQRLPFTESTEDAHMAGGKAVVDASDLLVAVWDGKPARGHGGTADVVTYARQRNVPVVVVWPEGATR